MLSDRSREYWDFFISEGVRDDEALSALAANVRASQPMANLLFGAVHYLLLRGAVHPLSAHYRTLTEESTLRSGDPFPLFRQFCFAHEAEIAALLATRVTNTNEVARSLFARRIPDDCGSGKRAPASHRAWSKRRLESAL